MEKPFDILFFDLGNTLMYFDTSPDVVAVRANHALYLKLAEFGMPVSEAEFVRTYIEFNLQSLAERSQNLVEHRTIDTLTRTVEYLGISHLTEKELRQGLKALFQEYEDHWLLGDDTVDTLETLKKDGYHLGIISNAADRDDFQRLIKKGNLHPYFEKVVVSATEGVRKPHPQIFEKALSQFKVPSERCLMVGDTLSADIMGANQCGIGSVWITRWADTVENRALANQVTPMAKINKLGEVPKVLKNWKKKKAGG
jgi:HAD superfamily hydrolase (TIGR01662 family)